MVLFFSCGVETCILGIQHETCTGEWESAARQCFEWGYFVHFIFFFPEKTVQEHLGVALAFFALAVARGTGGAGAAGARWVHMSSGVQETAAIWSGSVCDECCH